MRTVIVHDRLRKLLELMEQKTGRSFQDLLSDYDEGVISDSLLAFLEKHPDSQIQVSYADKIRGGV